MNRLLQLLRDAIAACYRDPRPTVSPWRWADDHVYLDEKASPRPGPYRSAETPWTRRFQDIFIDPDFTEALVMKSSRTGFTEAALNVVRYMPEHAPGTVLFCLDSKEEARKVSNDRLATSLRQAAADQMSDDPDDDGTLTKRLLNMTVLLAGSYSAGVFRNKWVRLGVLDEVEVNPEVPGEGATLDLMRSRFVGVGGARLLAMSKPKKFCSTFHKQHAEGTCEIALAPCPHCGTYQEFTFDGQSATTVLHIDNDGTGKRITGALLAQPPPLGRVEFEHCRDLLGVYDKRALLTKTYYRCVSGCRIDETDKPRILAQLAREGVHWLRTNPTPFPGRCSQHISDLLSPYPEVAWGQLALIWTSCADQVARDHFRNNHLGLPAREQAAVIAESTVLDCRSAYTRGTCPFAPDLVTLNWDTQDDLVHWGALGFRLVPGRDLPEIAVIDHGKAFHSDELLQVAADIFKNSTGDDLKITVGVGDAGGHRTADIYETCLKSLTGTVYLFPSFGRGGMQARNPLRETVFKHGQREVTGYLYSDDQYKRRLYFDIIAKIPEIRKEAAERSLTLATPQVRLHLYADILETKEGEEFVRGLTKERTLERTTRKGVVVEWDENIRGNESGDILKVGLVTFDFMRPALQRAAAQAAAAKAAADKKAA